MCVASPRVWAGAQGCTLSTQDVQGLPPGRLAPFRSPRAALQLPGLRSPPSPSVQPSGCRLGSREVFSAFVRPRVLAEQLFTVFSRVRGCGGLGGRL